MTKRELKRLYDIEYRKNNREKNRAAAWFRADYAAHPEKYRAQRSARRAAHAEYCRSPEYKKEKHRYDRTRYAKQKFGPFWESHVLAMDIKEECLRQMSRYEIMFKKNTLNKALRRSRNGKT